MKKMKKILAVLLALTMVLGMGLTSMAAAPNARNKTTATVKNVEVGATVKAYQIVKAKYDTSGFKGYEKAKDTLKIADVINPTPAEVTAIANGIAGKELTEREMKTTATAPALLGDYTAELEAGWWIVVVTGTVKEVYNPMLVGVYYGNSGDTLSNSPVDANTSWILNSTPVYAKSSSTRLTKNSDATTYDYGDTVKYTITALVPDYSDAYNVSVENENEITFSITDTVAENELEIQTDTIAVKVGDTSVDASKYTLTATKAGYTLTFKDSWIVGNKNNTVTVTYDALLSGEIYANNTEKNANMSHDNTAVLTYSITPGTGANTTATDTVYESVYTFKVEELITKTGEDKDDDGDADPLGGAVFTIYTDSSCTEAVKYTNTKHPNGTVTSDTTTGYINIYGLDASPEGITYYIKETVAPEGYSLNNEVFSITVKASETKDNAKRVQDTVGNAEITVKRADGTPTSEIPNTKLNALPSTGGIGTTIFTVAGCGIMVAAAYLFFASRKKESN